MEPDVLKKRRFRRRARQQLVFQEVKDGLYEVHLDGERIHLSPLEFSLLKILAEKPDDSVSQAELLEQLHLTTHGLHTLVYRLRAKVSWRSIQRDYLDQGNRRPSTAYRLADTRVEFRSRGAFEEVGKGTDTPSQPLAAMLDSGPENRINPEN